MLPRPFRYAILLFSILLTLLSATLLVVRRQPAESAMIAFASNRNGHFEIFRVLPDGRLERQLTPDPAAYYIFPIWSPDAEWLVMEVAYPNEAGDIYRIRPSGRQLQRLTFNLSNDWSPVWSPDGRWIAFLSERSGASDIYRMRPDGRGVERLTYTAHTKRELLWSPDGQWLAFVATDADTQALYRIRPDGSDLERLEFDDRIYFTHTFHSLVWSPDSQWLTYASGAGRISRLNLASGKAQILVTSAGYFQDLTWSPDGQWLAFVEQRRSPTFGFRIGRVHLSTQRVEWIMPPATNYRDLRWSPDGKWLLFGTGQLATDLYRVRPDGSGLEQLTLAVGDDMTPAWSPIIEKSWAGGLLLGGSLGILGLMARRVFFNP